MGSSGGRVRLGLSLGFFLASFSQADAQSSNMVVWNSFQTLRQIGLVSQTPELCISGLRARASELEPILSSPSHVEFLAQSFCNRTQPNWYDTLTRILPYFLRISEIFSQEAIDQIRIWHNDLSEFTNFEARTLAAWRDLGVQSHSQEISMNRCTFDQVYNTDPNLFALNQSIELDGQDKILKLATTWVHTVNDPFEEILVYMAFPNINGYPIFELEARVSADSQELLVALPDWVRAEMGSIVFMTRVRSSWGLECAGVSTFETNDLDRIDINQILKYAIGSLASLFNDGVIISGGLDSLDSALLRQDLGRSKTIRNDTVSGNGGAGCAMNPKSGPSSRFAAFFILLVLFMFGLRTIRSKT